MKKITIYATIVILLLSFTLAGCGNNATGQATGLTGAINANSCNADSVCETNTVTSQNVNTNILTSTGITTQEATVKSLISSGSSYVCATSAGQIYRSDIPCTNLEPSDQAGGSCGCASGTTSGNCVISGSSCSGYCITGGTNVSCDMASARTGNIN